jgi:hypothetical protein
LLPVALALGAAILYAQNLGDADRMYFDEKIYVPYSYQMSIGVWEDPCWAGTAFDQRPVNWPHPPWRRKSWP